MEAPTLYIRQKDIISTIQTIKTNFKKDSASRKTPEYITSRTNTLNNLWGEFEMNHQKLVGYDDRTSEYFVKNIYDDTKRTYEEVLHLLTSYRGQENKGTQPDEKLNALINEQKTNFRAFQRYIQNIDMEQINNKWEIEDELRNLQLRWNNIDTLHWKIDNILEGSDMFYEKEYTDFETRFKNSKRELSNKLSSAVHLQHSTPQLEVPVFTGNYTQWPTFLDLFKGGIHENNLLTKAQKMQHLKGKLKGEAERLVQHLHVSAENYDIAWEILNHRYNNQQVLFTKQIEIFLNQPAVQKQNSYELRRLHDTTMECIHAIHNLGIDTTTWDPILVHLLVKKLDTHTYSDYMESRKEPRKLPVFEEAISFLETKFTALEPIKKHDKDTAAANNTGSSKSSTYKEKSSFAPGKKTAFTRTSHVFHCVLCNTNHALYQCSKFESMSPDVKLATVSKHNVCKNCLFVHEKNICNSTKRCKECNAAHNTLLHEACVSSDVTSSSAKPSTARKQQQSRQQNVNHIAGVDNEILLTSVQMRVLCKDGHYINLTALLDQGSQISLITENAAQRLGLPRQHFNGAISGVGTLSNKGKGKINLRCKSIHDDYSFNTDVLIMPKLIKHLPSNTFDNAQYMHINNLPLADPEFNISKPIDILLDAKIYSEIIMNGLVKGSPQEPIAQQTKMGWILSGNITPSFNCHVVINNIEDISNYWEIEDIPSDTEMRNLTQQDQFCENLFMTTTRRLPSGRYEVRLPMKEGFECKLGDSKPQAVAQFKQQERKFQKDDNLRDNYKRFIDEYINMGHMKKCVTRTKSSCILPHHGVIKNDSITTKLRVVFNGSSKTTSGFSLNDLMECGPKLQQDILSLLLRWRIYKIAFTADCEKMYRMVLIQEDQQHLQKIVWRDQPTRPLEEYQLCTVTYGTKAAPYLAMRTIKQLASDDAQKYPIAAKILNNDLFVDDLLSGAHTVEQAKHIQAEVIDMLNGAGFNLRKWSSNTPELLTNLTENQLNPSVLDFKNADSTKTLGLRWSPSTDTFTYQNKIDLDTDTYSKRTMLSDISKIFDPLGWLSPITLKAKLIFQRVWSTDITWNDTVPQEIQNEWKLLRDDLDNINRFEIPRWIGTSDADIEIHGFCDASEKAYACVIYAKTRNESQQNSIRLIAAKTKLAPSKKKLTLPRLELCGALLLTKLVAKVLQTFAINNIHTQTYAWTDSMVVLGWLHGNPSRWNVFVSNRTQQITEVIPAIHWRHTKSSDNAADCATRGLTPSQLIEHSLWWKGPAWLKDDINENTLNIEDPDIELKREHKVMATRLEYPLIENILEKYSSITHAARVMSWVSRFITNTRYHMTKKTKCDSQIINNNNYLTSSEIENAYNIFIRMAQYKEYHDDIAQIQRTGSIKTSSNLLKLNPFLDKHGILRVGGRLEYSNLASTTKHPIILPKTSRLTELLINQAHKSTLHGGPRLTLTYLRQKFWIISGYVTVKKHIRRCITCCRFSNIQQNQLMANLPESRVTPSRPFTHTGVDFTGHVDVKANKGRGIKLTKGYIAVFVCFATKAVHLELVSDLSTPTFLAAFKRFCSRRGVPKHVYSDNGTNFIGASRVIKKEYREALQMINTDFLNDIADMNITWHFNSPAWPSAGGLWEAAVKSMKHHLKRILGEQKLTYEEFSTLLTQIEACLNSRPLYAMTENPEDEYLTPGHFLTGGPILSSPLTVYDTHSIKTRWQLTEHMHQQFWKKWSSDYLQQLQSRHKWNTPKKSLCIDDIVLIKEDNMPPSKWALGRVTELHPGKDGYVRVVTVKTKSGTMKRPIIKLSPLPVHDEETICKSDNTEESDKRKPRAARKNKRNFLVTTLLLLLTFVTPSLQQTVHVNTFNNSNSLYFDKIADIKIVQDQWKMVVFYNMTSYWQSIVDIEYFLRQISKPCRDEPMLTFLASQLYHQLNEITHRNNLLTNIQTSRKKRGLINGVGYIANSLFGVLDEEFAKKYEKDIKLIQIREDHLFTLFKNQTSIMEAENNIIKRNEATMNKNFITINEHMQQITSDMNKFQNNIQTTLQKFYLITALTSANVIISNIQRLQDDLIDTVTDIYHGRINSHLLSPDQIQQQLNIISSQIHGELKIPGNSVKDLYGLMQIKARVTSKLLIMEIRIPLLHHDEFELDSIITIPLQKGANAVYTQPESKYIAVNVNKDTVIPMTEHDVQSCVMHAENELICPLNHPIYTLKMGESICKIKYTRNNDNNYCHMEIKECTIKWIKLHTPDSWLFSCCEECSVRILCPDGLATKQLHGSGVITIGQGCVLKGDMFTIHSHHKYMNQMFIQPAVERLPNISQLNNILNTSVTTQDIIITANHTAEFHDIKQQISNLKKQQLEEGPLDDTPHYYIIYGILTTLSVAFLIAIGYKVKQRRIRKQTRGPAGGAIADPEPGVGVAASMTRQRSDVNVSVIRDESFSSPVLKCNPNNSESFSPIVRNAYSVTSVNKATSPTMNRTVSFSEVNDH